MLKLMMGVALAFAIIDSAQAQDYPLSGQKGQIASSFIGCKERKDYDRMISIAQSGDQEAFMKFAVSRIPDCVALEKGTEVFVENVAVFAGTLCARPRGKVDCYWYPSKFVAK